MRKDRVISHILGGQSPLTPSDLYHREFPRSIVGGYQPSQVDAFLTRVADMLESLIQENQQLKEVQAANEARLDEYHQIEEALRSALVTSQKFSESVVDSAKREAELMIEEARLRKERLDLEAGKLPPELAREIERLTLQRDRLRHEIKATLTAHQTLLDAPVPQVAPVFDEPILPEEN